VEVSLFVTQLRNAHWLWTQPALAQLALNWGWEPSGGATESDLERKTYTSPWGWGWSVYSRYGIVTWTETTVNLLTTEGRWSEQQAWDADQQLSAEYNQHVGELRGVLGREEFEGGPADEAPGFARWDHAVRLCRWRLPAAWLSLGYFVFRDEPNTCWLSVLLEPPGAYPEPPALPPP
jgi:hypothetical protein